MDSVLTALRPPWLIMGPRCCRELVCATVTIIVALGLCAPAAHAQPDGLGEAVRDALGLDADTRYFEARVDLNGDGKPEAVVYAAGPMVCGTGGCPLLVFKRQGQRYRLVSQTSVVQTPVLLSPERHHGWHSLVVAVHGGGATPARMELRFDGKSYPRNATVPPARPADRLNDMQTLISEFGSYQDGKPVPRGPR